MSGPYAGEKRWGLGDQAGAGNLMTPKLRRAALDMVTSGEIYDLSHTIERGAPIVGPHQTAYSLDTKSWPQDGIANRRKAGATNDAGAMMEHIEMSVHVGTHIDALGHFSIGDELYGGHSVEKSIDEHGLMRRRVASINDVPIKQEERKFHWPQGRRPDDHPGLSELSL